MAMKERDKDLLALLAVARYLEHDQVQTLVFPGLSRQVMEVRLNELLGAARPKKLSRGRRGEDEKTEETDARALQAKQKRLAEKPAYLMRLEYTPKGASRPVAIWGLTQEGYNVASDRLGVDPIVKPDRELAEKNLRHHLRNTDLFVALLQAGGRRAVRRRPHAPGEEAVEEFGHYLLRPEYFRWVGERGIRLPWAAYNQTTNQAEGKERRPDAVLELVNQRRRILVEYESGSNPVTTTDAKEKGDSLGKLNAYAGFMEGYQNPVKHVTWYQAAYPDNWPAEVLFVVETEGRKKNLQALYESWRLGRTRPVQARVYLASEVGEVLAREIFGEEGVLRLRRAQAAQGRADAENGQAVRIEDAALKGRVTWEEVLFLGKGGRGALQEIQRLREKFRQWNAALPPGAPKHELPSYPFPDQRDMDRLTDLLDRLCPEGEQATRSGGKSGKS